MFESGHVTHDVTRSSMLYPKNPNFHFKRFIF
jgi:hypothetical protein